MASSGRLLALAVLAAGLATALHIPDVRVETGLSQPPTEQKHRVSDANAASSLETDTNLQVDAEMGGDLEDAVELEDGLGTIETHIDLMQVEALLGKKFDFKAWIKKETDFILCLAVLSVIAAYLMMERAQIKIEKGDAIAEVSRKKAYARFCSMIIMIICYNVFGILMYTGNHPLIYLGIDLGESGGIGESVRSVVYFLAVTSTTVGYGDYLPSTPAGKLFTAFYGTFGVMCITAAAGDIVIYLVALKAARDSAKLQASIESTTSQPEDKGSHTSEEDQAKDLQVAKFKALFPIIGQVTAAFLMQWLIDGELGSQDYTQGCEDGVTWSSDECQVGWVDFFYFAMITVTTIGYGDYSFASPWGQILGTPFLFNSVVVVSNALAQLSEIMDQKDYTVDLEEMLDEDNSGSITKDEFMTRMLIRLNMVENDVLANIRKQFEILDVDGSGELDAQDVKLIKEKYGVSSSALINNHGEVIEDV